MEQSLTVFFDGGCPLCSSEIAHYRHVAPGHRIRWIDVTREPEEARRRGIELRQAMAHFHVMGADGTCWTGAAAFVRLWREMPRYQWLPSVCETLHLLPLMEWAYSHFARRRFARRCRDAACGA